MTLPGEHTCESYSDQNGEIVRLRAENEMLRGRIGRLALQQQHALELSHRLDQEAARFDAMQRFIQKAVLIEACGDLGALISESIIDLLECGVGLLWCFNSCQPNGKNLYHSGIPDVSPELFLEMKEWVDILLDHYPKEDSSNSGWKKSLPPLPAGLSLRDNYLIEVVMDVDHRPQGIVIACNTIDQSRFRQNFEPSAGKVFSTFARQVGVLVVSLKRRLTIAEQIEQIQLSEDRLSTALIGSNVGLWDWNLLTDEVFYSDQWKIQLGLDLDEVGSSPQEWIKRLHPDEAEHAVKIATAVKSVAKGQFDLTFRMRCKNRRWKWINSRGYAVSGPDGAVIRMIGTHIDVTEYKLLENKLLRAEKKQRRAKEQAERQSSAKSSFLAAVSHEIRTPLNGILGAFQMLRLTDNPEKKEGLLRLGEESGEWMLKIIGESLDITRIEARKMELKPEVVDLHELLESIRGNKERRALDQGLDLRWEVSPQVPQMVMVDPGRLKQVLTNLINNAFKFTSKGFVEVKVSAVADERARCRQVEFVIADSGVGFSKEFARMMFKPFTQALKKSQSSLHGIGLGLGIVKELVRLMGGRIHATSKPGQGSCFVVSLPMEEVPLIEKVPRNHQEIILPKFNGDILLAEDDEISAIMAKMMMEKIGLRVVVAKDGNEAFAMASKTRFDLIFMDGWMPVMSGLEVTRKLRSSIDCASSGVPIIALTANARASDAVDCIEAGMNDFMTKPLMFPSLIEKLNGHLAAERKV